MLMKNPTPDAVKVGQLGLEVAPGATVDIDDGYCYPRRAGNGALLESIIEMLAPQLEPADKELVEGYRAHTLEQPARPPQAPQGVRYADVAGLPPAVQQLATSGPVDAVPRAAPKPAPTPKQQAQAQAEAAKKPGTP